MLVFAAVGNVNVIGKVDFVTYRGPTTVASTLHVVISMVVIETQKHTYPILLLEKSAARIYINCSVCKSCLI